MGTLSSMCDGQVILEAEKIEINHLLFLNKTVNLYRVSEMKEKIQYSYLFNAVASTIINVSGKVCFVIKHLAKNGRCYNQGYNTGDRHRGDDFASWNAFHTEYAYRKS
ncbi:predicted protein [Histoplasma capsulatum G186AR]|uniref:Uncharacterized protein n=1 Tax=Ajellomyces capsulatus (strain G186AR / H82 / ATCC MYA-2454 / RMSCC 2432) TaxID=447093 RepID=C0NZR9_AJECG|nr:uncharacterized protein HCBG_08649 [Histoplasma capsulatum G186AR]EEH03009.1 predicted protein [Histoplasma capsulatum G186AR]